MSVNILVYLKAIWYLSSIPSIDTTLQNLFGTGYLICQEWVYHGALLVTLMLLLPMKKEEVVSYTT